MIYAFSERYILPLSHDEVVHVKGSIINKMPGEYEAKFAGERALLGFMYAHPGKKLNFMGYEFAQFREWDYNSGLDFFLADEFEQHSGMRALVKALNVFYKNNPPLYEIEDDWTGFKWLVVDDNYNNLVAFTRFSKSGKSITAVINFSGIELLGYKVPIEKGRYRLVFNSEEKAFGGSGKLRKKVYLTEKQTGGNGEYYVKLNIPRLTCMYLKKD